MKIGLCITALLVINIPLWMGDAVLSIFTSDATVYEIARPIFYVSVIMEMGRILNIIIINSLRAVNDAKFPMLMAIISMWGVSVPVGTFLSLYMGMGLLGVWLGFCCDECTRGLVMLLRWKSKAWVSKARDNYRKHYKTKVKKKGYAL